MSITRLGTHQTSSQQIKTMTRENDRNYQQNPNPINRPYQHNIRPRASPTFNRQQHNRNGKNPCDRNGIQLRCNICESIYHMAQNCPEKHDLYYTQEVILSQSDFDHLEQIKNLASESWNTAELDSGATNTVAGKEWYNCYISSLSFDEKTKIRRHKGTNIYRFGDGNLFTAIENIDIPIVLGKQHVMLNTGILASDFPLLLSRKSLKKADRTLDFKNDNAIVFGESVKLITTKPGHYTISISPNKTVLNNLTTGISTNITLITTQTGKSKYDIALKLHLQFAHPPPERIVKLLNSAGDPWKDDDELKSLIKKVSDECQICQVYRKAPPPSPPDLC